MTQFFVQLPEGDIVTLEHDLNTATVAAVKATVDARLESAWRASGVRILRSDLPFCGIKLRYQNRILAMGEVLSSCEVGQGTTLYAEWPPKSEKRERRKRYDNGEEEETVPKTRVRGKKKEKSVEKKARREGAKKKDSKSVEESTQSTHEDGGGGGDGCVSDAQPGDNTELEVGDHAEPGGNGPQCTSEQVADEEGDEPRAEAEEGQDDGPTVEVEQGDPFADEEDNKENEEPLAWVPFEESSEDGSPPAEEWLLFDERNSGLEFDLMEEVLDS